jgi:hypothetical protein
VRHGFRNDAVSEGHVFWLRFRSRFNSIKTPGLCGYPVGASCTAPLALRFLYSFGEDRKYRIGSIPVKLKKLQVNKPEFLIGDSESLGYVAESVSTQTYKQL